MSNVELNLQGARLSLANFRQMLAELPEVDYIEMHPYQMQWYEEANIPEQVIHYGPFDGATEMQPLTICKVPVKENIRVAKNVVRFVKDAETIGELTHLAEPILN